MIANSMMHHLRIDITFDDAETEEPSKEEDSQSKNNNNGTITGVRQQRIVTIPSVYRGGERRVKLPVPESSDEIESSNNGMVSVVSAEQRLTRVANALEVGGWHSDDLVATCVLQTLLGGGSSFSAGGPGKGMYSRLFRQVLNKYRWAESAEAFTAFHTESGLAGITGSTQAVHAHNMVRVFCSLLTKLAVEPVSPQ